MEASPTDNPAVSSIDFLKTSTVLGPLFVSSLAVCYDVGFFYGLDPRFFTFFSLSEHLVFALQAIPFALIPALAVLIYVFMLWFGNVWFQRISNKWSESIKQMDLPTLQTFSTKIKVGERLAKIAYLVVKVALIGMALWFFSRHQYTNAVWFLICLVVPDIVSVPLEETTKIRRIVLIAFSISMSWLMAFAMGYEQADRVIANTRATEIVSFNNKDISARLIRGGERGILLFALETKTLTFLQWSSITKIETVAP
jgi:hypothetical protein